jgi:hypothetical protein
MAEAGTSTKDSLNFQISASRPPRQSSPDNTPEDVIVDACERETAAHFHAYQTMTAVDTISITEKNA